MKQAKKQRGMQSSRRQSGAVLIVGLGMVLILSVIAIAASQSTVIQQKMSTNMRDKELAFQAAETGLREAEGFLMTKTESQLKALVFDGNTPGLYDFDIDRALSEESDWNALNAKTSAKNMLQVRQKPKYIIEHMTDINAAGESLLAGQVVDSLYFRVTSKAKGGTDSSIAILQSIYKK